MPKQNVRANVAVDTVPHRTVIMSTRCWMSCHDSVAFSLEAILTTAGTVIKEVVANDP